MEDGKGAYFGAFFFACINYPMFYDNFVRTLLILFAQQ